MRSAGAVGRVPPREAGPVLCPVLSTIQNSASWACVMAILESNKGGGFQSKLLLEALLREGRAPASPKYWGVAALRPPALPCLFTIYHPKPQFYPLPMKLNEGQ